MSSGGWGGWTCCSILVLSCHRPSANRTDITSVVERAVKIICLSYQQTKGVDSAPATDVARIATETRIAYDTCTWHAISTEYKVNPTKETFYNRMFPIAVYTSIPRTLGDTGVLNRPATEPIYISIHPSTHPSIYPSIHPSICLSHCKPYNEFESRQEHKKTLGLFPSQKCCTDSLSVCPIPVCIFFTHA